MAIFSVKCTGSYIMEALSDLQQANRYLSGITLEKLTELLRVKYHLPKQYEKRINEALRRGIEFGAITCKQGRYSMGCVMDKVLRKYHLRETR